MTDTLNIRIHSGDSGGRRVVFLHGFASRGDTDWPDEDWSAAIDGLAPTRVVVDLPAHGDSSGLGAASASAIVDRLATELGEVDADLVGYSLGARLAWDLASHPAMNVRRVVLGGLSPAEPFAAVDVEAARGALAGGPAPQDPLTGMIFGMTQLPGNRPADLLDLVQGLASEPFDPQTRPPAQPVLLVGGQDDPMVIGIDEVASVLPDGRVLRVPGDHIGALHDPAFREAVRTFLGAP
jgi:pimeloyl-ACP methyl ester carboxylesterase